MAELDPSIILQAGNYNDPQKLISLQMMAQQLKAKQQETQNQNALRQLLQRPDAINPQTGLPTAAVVGDIARTGNLDQATSIAQANASEDQKRQAATAKRQEMVADMQHDATEGALSAYDDAVNQGLPPTAAQQKMQDYWSQFWEEKGKSGLLHPEEMPHQTNPSEPFLRNTARSYKDYRDSQAQAKAQEERQHHDDALERLATEKFNVANEKPTKDDPSMIAAANYEIDPRVLLGRGTPAQRRETMNVLREINPQFDERLFNSSQQALAAWNKGPQSIRITNANAAIAHLDTYAEYVRAFNSKDNNTINRARRLWETEFGSPAPNNLAMAAQFVANEVGKAVMPSSTGEERDKFEQYLSSIKSQPQQIGAAEGMQNFLAGQLRSAEQSYKSSTFRNDFRQKLLPRVNEILDSMPDPGRARGTREPGGTQAAPPARPVIGRLPDGTELHPVEPPRPPSNRTGSGGPEIAPRGGVVGPVRARPASADVWDDPRHPRGVGPDAKDPIPERNMAPQAPAMFAPRSADDKPTEVPSDRPTDAAIDTAHSISGDYTRIEETLAQLKAAHKALAQTMAQGPSFERERRSASRDNDRMNAEERDVEKNRKLRLANIDRHIKQLEDMFRELTSNPDEVARQDSQPSNRRLVTPYGQARGS